MADSSPGDRGCRQGGLETRVRGRTREEGVPAQGRHLPDGDFKDLIEFALQQRCLDTDRRK